MYAYCQDGMLALVFSRSYMMVSGIVTKVNISYLLSFIAHINGSVSVRSNTVWRIWMRVSVALIFSNISDIMKR